MLLHQLWHHLRNHIDDGPSLLSIESGGLQRLDASLYTMSVNFIVHLFGLEKELWPRSEGALNQKSICSFKFIRGDRKRMFDKTPVYGKQPEAFLLGLDKQ